MRALVGWRLRLILGVRRRRSRGTFRRTCWFVRPRLGASARRIPGRRSSGDRVVGSFGMVASSLSRLVPSWFLSSSSVDSLWRMVPPRPCFDRMAAGGPLKPPFGLSGAVRRLSKAFWRLGGAIGKRPLPICALGAPCPRLETRETWGTRFFHFASFSLPFSSRPGSVGRAAPRRSRSQASRYFSKCAPFILFAPSG